MSMRTSFPASSRFRDSRRQDAARRAPAFVLLATLLAGTHSPAAGPGATADPELAELEERLLDLRLKYTDRHPEVARLIRLIEERRSEKMGSTGSTVSGGNGASPAITSAQVDPYRSPPVPAGRSLNPALTALAPNRWVLFHRSAYPWRRQAHAGAVLDTKRGNLVIFGSDTHGRNWDNRVHVFDPYTESWSSMGEIAAPQSYGTDARGYAAAGENADLPWAMHTYDALVYDRLHDSLVVLSTPNHNPKKKQFSKRRDPTWIFDLTAHRWRIHEPAGGARPTAFGGASAYDEHRDVIVAYSVIGKAGVWELGPDRSEWTRAAGSRHRLHSNMVYDPHRRLISVFGNYNGSREVWEYAPGGGSGIPGHWRERSPSGDCPPLEAPPAAYDLRNRVFLAIHRGNSTCIFDPAKNRFWTLGVVTPDIGKLNYMLVYDPFHEVFLLVTGDHTRAPEVWSFRYHPEAVD